MKAVIVINDTDLDSSLREKLVDHLNDISDDCYRRWYFRPQSGTPPALAAAMDDWFTVNHVTTSPAGTYEHCLIHFSW